MESHLIAALESVLFIQGEAVKFSVLQRILQVSEEKLNELLIQYSQLLVQEERGLTLIRHNKSARLGVKNEYVSFVENLKKNELEADLSKAGLEVLAIVAYLAPVSRVDIDAIRGVNSSYTLRNLALRGLVERKGNPQDSRGYVYEPSIDFLTTLGITTIDNLSEFQKLRNDSRLQMLLGKEKALDEIIETDAHAQA